MPKYVWANAKDDNVNIWRIFILLQIKFLRSITIITLYLSWSELNYNIFLILMITKGLKCVWFLFPTYSIMRIFSTIYQQMALCLKICPSACAKGVAYLNLSQIARNCQKQSFHKFLNHFALFNISIAKYCSNGFKAWLV